MRSFGIVELILIIKVQASIVKVHSFSSFGIPARLDWFHYTEKEMTEDKKTTLKKLFSHEHTWSNDRVL
jgi:hypothetical protein